MSTDIEQRFPSARIIGRGVTVAPALKSGIGLTFLFAVRPDFERYVRVRRVAVVHGHEIFGLAHADV